MYNIMQRERSEMMKKATKARIGIIGLGFMGTTHWGIYKGLKNACITAVADVDAKKRAGDVSSVVGNIGDGDNSKPLDLTGVTVYESGLALISDADVDIVDICVPTPDHADLVCAALAAGKHVFCEKPLCRDAAQMKRILAAAKKARGFFNVGLCVRAWPEYRHAYEYYRSGKAGKMRSATFKRISPSIAGNAWHDWFMDGAVSGGALLDMHVHDADEVNCFFGTPKSVTAFGAADIVSRNGGVDHVMAVYDYGDGTLVTAEGGWGAAKGVPFEMSFTIVCEKATLKLDASGYHIYPVKGKPIAPKVDAKAGPTGWHQELTYFVNCVLKGVKPDKYQTLDSVEKTMKLIFAEARSVKTGKPIRL